MIRVKVCLVSEGASRDADTNTVSIFSILEGIAGANFPLFVQRMVCFALWERDDGDPQTVQGRFRVRLNDEVLNEVAASINFGGYLRTRNFVRLNGIVIPRPGTLRFAFELEGGLRAEYALSVEAQQVEPIRVVHNV
jgi:hypothetical protein